MTGIEDTDERRGPGTEGRARGLAAATGRAARLLDARLPRPLLVVGSLPPDGRDLDLLVVDSDRRAVEDALESVRLERRGSRWIGTAGTDLVGASVELIRAEEWGLGPEGPTWILSESLPVPGFDRLLRPAAHVVLLILSRRLGAEGRLDRRRRRSVMQALTEDPLAWERAAQAARTWSAEASLAWLREAYEGDGRGRRRTRVRAARERLGTQHAPPRWVLLRALHLVARHPADPLPVLALSGLDGSGKSTQARLLTAALQEAGWDPVVLWDRISQNPVLLRVTSPLRLVLRLVPGAVGRLAIAEEPSSGEDAPGFVLSEDVRAARGVRSRLPWLDPLWITLVTLVHGIPLRRRTLQQVAEGRAVIWDRYLLDSLVQLEDRYGSEQVRVQQWLLRRLVPRPAASFYLDVPAQEAFHRKPDEFSVAALDAHRELYVRQADRLGAHVLDGRAPVPQLAQLLADEGLRALPPGRRRR